MAIDWPGWIQAVVVSAGLIFTGIQFKLDKGDRAEEAKRQELATLDEKIRHRVEMEDRRRERLISGYSQFCDGAIEFLTRHREAAELDVLAEEQFEVLKKDPASDRKHDGALRIREGVMRIREQARMGMSRAMAAHFALRFDEDERTLRELDTLFDDLLRFKGGATEKLLERVVNLTRERSDQMRPR